MTSISVNPVLRRELIERWRGRRAFVVVTVYLAVLVGVMMLLLWVGREIITHDFGFNDFNDPGPLLGRFLLENLVTVVLLLVLFIGPGYAAAQVSGERERKTLGLLQVTLVKPWSIVVGKLGAAVAWLVLLVVAAVPMGAVAFFLGGVTLADLARAALYVVLVAISVAAIGIGVSAMVRKTTASIVITYSIVLMLTLGSLFATVVEAVMRDFGAETPISLYANPFYGLADAVRAEESNRLPSVLALFSYGLPNSDVMIVEDFGAVPVVRGGVEVLGDAVDGVGAPALDEVLIEPVQVFDEQSSREPVWLRVLGIYLALGAGALVVASRRVRPGHGPRRRRARGDRVVQAPAPPPDLPPPAWPAPDAGGA